MEPPDPSFADELNVPQEYAVLVFDVRYTASKLFMMIDFPLICPLRPMGISISVLGYHINLLKCYHPACGHEGSSHLSPVLALRFFYRNAGVGRRNSVDTRRLYIL